MTEETVGTGATPEGAVPEAAPETPPESARPETPSVSESFRRALKEMEEREAGAAKPSADKPASDERPRNPDGTFAPKEAASAHETAVPQQAAAAPLQPAETQDAPAWLHNEAKAEWAKAPQSVRAEVSRRIGELENGLNEYRARWEPLKEFEELARQTGTTIPDALRNYVGIEMTLRQEPVRGVETIFRNLNMDLRKFAEWYLQQPAKTPEQLAAERHMDALRAQQEALNRQNSAMAQQMVDAFFASHPRAHELGEVMGYLISTGKATGLQDAYEKAAQLIPAPAPAAPAAPPAAQTRTPTAPRTSNADLSLDGAPASNAATVVRSKTNAEAIQRAAARVGLSL